MQFSKTDFYDNENRQNVPIPKQIKYFLKFVTVQHSFMTQFGSEVFGSYNHLIYIGVESYVVNLILFP